VGINTTTESSALYVNSETGAYGYSTILGVVNDYTKAFAVHKNDGSTTSENFRIYGNGETNISVDENVKAFSVSRRGSSSTVDNFTVNGNGEVEAKRIKIGDVTTPSSSDYTLYVEKGVLAERLKCALKSTSDWSDFVFDDCYELKSLNEVEEYIKKNKHLPDVPSAEQMVETGLDVAKTNAILLRKIEELTLYVIELKKQMND
jgi:hypothetical protein